MKIVCVSDLQAYNYTAYSETDERGVNLRLLDTVKELKRLHTLSLKNGVGMFAVLGDVFEIRSSIEISVLNAIYESLYAFHESGIRVLLLVGNHDRASLHGDHALKIFRPWATVIDKPMTLPLEGGGNLVGIPFHPRGEAIRTAIHRYVNDKTSLLILHCAIKSTRLPDGRIWGEGVSLEDIPKETTTLLGHYHRWSELRSGKVWYLGSMTPIDWGDVGQDKFYCVVNTLTKAVQFHHTRAPQFITMELGLKDGMVQDPAQRITPSQLDVEKYLAVVPGNFLKIKRVPIGFTDFTGLQVVLQSLGARHVSFDMDTIAQLVATEAESTTLAQEWAQMPVTSMLEHYIDTTKHNLEPQRLVDTGRELMGLPVQEPVNETSETSTDDPLESLADDVEESFEDYLKRVQYIANPTEEDQE